MLSRDELNTVNRISFVYENYNQATIDYSDKRIIDDSGRVIAHFLRNANGIGFQMIPNFEVSDEFDREISSAYRGFFTIKNVIEEIIGREVGY
jgi:hypothetical protein